MGMGDKLIRIMLIIVLSINLNYTHMFTKIENKNEILKNHPLFISYSIVTFNNH